MRERISVSFNWKGENYWFPAETILEKEMAFDKIKTMINQSFANDDFEKMLQAVFGKFQPNLFRHCEKLAMSWNDIKMIAQDPLVTIGAHTVNHFPLKQIKITELRNEVLNSKKILEKEILQPVEHFAYPFGKATEASFREFEMVKFLGFKTGTTTRMGNIFSQHKNHTECLPRISLNRVSTEAVLNLQTSGMLPFIYHKGKRMITH